jgi:hypothetical protein
LRQARLRPASGPARAGADGPRRSRTPRPCGRRQPVEVDAARTFHSSRTGSSSSGRGSPKA